MIDYIIQNFIEFSDLDFESIFPLIFQQSDDDEAVEQLRMSSRREVACIKANGIYMP